jgi:hypothetical protein
VPVLVTTTDGYLDITPDTGGATGLAGHRVDDLTPTPDGGALAVVDGHAVWSCAAIAAGADGEWSTVASSEADLTSVVSALGAVFAGTADARVLRVDDTGELVPVPAFDHVTGRDEWHGVGMPLQVRTMTATADGGAVLANVHVGGIPRSVDGGATWQPTIAVDDDVHQVLAHPSRPEVVAAAASVGLCRSHDAGATWTSTTDGLAMSYARGVAIVGDDVLVTVSDGPWSERAAVYRAALDGGPLSKVTGGLPEHLHGNVDSRCIASDGDAVALVDGHGDVWWAAHGCDGFRPLAHGLTGVTGIAIT